MSGFAIPDDDREMALGAYGRRQLGRSLAWSVVYMAVAVPVLWPVMEAYWIPACYVVGIGVGTLCGRRLSFGESSGWRRVLAGLASTGGMPAVAVLLVVWMGCALAGAVILTLHGLAGTELAAGEFERVWMERVVEAFSWESASFALGVTYFLLSAVLFGLIDGIWIGRVSAGTAVPVWKVLPGSRVWREGLTGDRRRRREYLLGQGGRER